MLLSTTQRKTKLTQTKGRKYVQRGEDGNSYQTNRSEYNFRLVLLSFASVGNSGRKITILKIRHSLGFKALIKTGHFCIQVGFKIV